MHRNVSAAPGSFRLMKCARAMAVAVMTFALLAGGTGFARADNLAAAASTFYILAPGADASIGPLVHSLTDRLQQLFDSVQPGAVWVIQRSSWASGDLGDQCENDPGKANPAGPVVLGGVILEGTNTYSSTDPFVLWNHGWAKVTTNAELVSCAPVGFKQPTITWVSNDLQGYGSRNGFPFETVAAGALVFLVKNTDTKYIALGSAIGGESGASTIPPVNDALTTRDAALRLANDLIIKLNAACGQKNANILAMCQKLGLPRAKLPTPPNE
jgi:hypothetical protein